MVIILGTDFPFLKASKQQIVEQLKPNYRTLVKLRYFKELTYEEIATELDIPLGTVKAQLFRSREQLFNIMSGHKGKF